MHPSRDKPSSSADPAVRNPHSAPANDLSADFDELANSFSLHSPSSMMQSGASSEGYIRCLPHPRMSFKVPPTLSTSSLVSNCTLDSSMPNQFEYHAFNSTFTLLNAQAQPVNSDFNQFYPNFSSFNFPTTLTQPDYSSFGFSSLLAPPHSFNVSHSEASLPPKFASQFCEDSSVPDTMSCPAMSLSHLASPPSIPAFDFTNSYAKSAAATATVQSPTSSCFFESLATSPSSWTDTPIRLSPETESSHAALRNQSSSPNAATLQIPNYVESYPEFDFDVLFDEAPVAVPNSVNKYVEPSTEAFLANLQSMSPVQSNSTIYSCFTTSNNLLQPVSNSYRPPTPPRVRVTVSDGKVICSRKNNNGSKSNQSITNAVMSHSSTASSTTVERSKRCTITGRAKEFLLLKFSENRLPTLQEYTMFAAEVNVEVKQVRTWFKNMRLRSPATVSAASGRFNR